MNWDSSTLESSLNYTFVNKALLEEACRHSSYVNEQTELGVRDNERLEFLGDTVLNLIVSHLLMEYHPDSSEGDLSRIRSTLVNEAQLAENARNMNLGLYLMLGKGEIQNGGNEKPSILADAYEAVIAAVYLDGGFQNAFNFIERHYDSLINADMSHSPDYLDYKSKLQELVQSIHKITPSYEMIGEIGPDHDKTFIVRISVCNVQAEGIGKSKKSAEQEAAKQAYEILNKQKI